MRPGRRVALAVLALCLAACGGGSEDLATGAPARRTATPPTPTTSPTPTAPTPATSPAPTVPAPTVPPTPTGSPSPAGVVGPTPRPTADPTSPEGVAEVPARPAWLGSRPLLLRPDGFGEVLDTPPELADRQLPPPSPPPLPPPADGAFQATVGPVPAEVAARSTWTPDCPAALEDLRYVTLSFRGFDGAAHTGELLVHAEAADDLVGVFRTLFEEGFPIEEMRVVDAPELDAPPTGDGNNTTAFVCRPTRGSVSWSQHAYGLAVDVNPFHNPYVRGDLVLPELASAYTDRSRHRPGMVLRGDAVTAAFASIGWGWGGDWAALSDPMHFSATGR